MTNSLLPFGVVFDIQALQNPLHRDRGIGRYITDHVNALLDAKAPLLALVLNPTLELPPVPQRWIDIDLLRWNVPATLRAASDRAERVIYHVPSPFEPTEPGSGVVVRHALRTADVLSVMVFDAIPFVFPEIHQRTSATIALFRRRASLIRTADLVLTISEHTRTDAISIFSLDPQRVVNHGTGGSSFFHPVHDSVPAVVKKPYVFTVTGWGDPRKDTETLFRAFANLDPDLRATMQLVVACSLPPEGIKAWGTAIEAVGLTPNDVVFTGQITDVELRALYCHASVFVMTSRYEGFGLPVLEAARCGVPAITTNATSIPEILDFEPSTFAPGDDQALTQLLKRALQDVSFRTALTDASASAAATHTWPNVADATMRAWTRRAASLSAASAARTQNPTRTPTPRTTRPNIAMLGPFPPSKSGIGTFNARVSDALAVDCALDWFTEGDNRMPSERNRRIHGHYPVEAFGRTIHHGAYDSVIYTIGNGHYHRKTLAAALRYPGIVWLHDAYLAGLYLTSQGLFLNGNEATPATIQTARTAMRELAQQWYGSSAGLRDNNWWRTDTYDDLQFPMLRGLLSNARALIVNTNAAAAIARTEAPADLSIHVLPLPFPKFDSAIEQRNPSPPQLIVSMGWVDSMKRPADLIRAVAHASQRVEQVLRLVFVGELDAGLRHELEAIARDCGLTDSVTFTGFISEEHYNDWLRRADVAVQLRTVTRGEASAALCDAIAHGVPTITSITTASDLPSDIIRLIPPESTVEIIGDAIAEVLTDTDTAANMGQSAKSHATTWGFNNLAASLLDICTALPAANPYPQPAAPRPAAPRPAAQRPHHDHPIS